MTSVSDVVESLGAAMVSHVREPFALFGHSLGALLAYELTHWLMMRSAPQPDLLILSGRMAPHRARQSTPLSSLSDADFVAAMHDKYGGIPDVLRDSPELQRLFLPSMRADMEMLDNYSFKRPTRLVSSDLLVLGADDDPTTDAPGLRAWDELTLGRTTLTTLPTGQHFFPQTRAREVTGIVVDALAARLTAW